MGFGQSCFDIDSGIPNPAACCTGICGDSGAGFDLCDSGDSVICLELNEDCDPDSGATDYSDCCTGICEEDFGSFFCVTCLADNSQAECDYNSDCCSGNCEEFTCLPEVSCAPVTDKCELDNDCCTGLCSIESPAIEGLCVTCYDDDEACVNDVDCCSAFCTSGGVCAEDCVPTGVAQFTNSCI